MQINYWVMEWEVRPYFHLLQPQTDGAARLKRLFGLEFRLIMAVLRNVRNKAGHHLRRFFYS